MYDVILYFCGVHTSHIHKYLNLFKSINKNNKAVLLLDNGKWGVKEASINLFAQNFNLKNVHSVSQSSALEFLRKNKHKIGIFSSNYRKGNVGNQDIIASKSTGALTMQLSEMPFDFYYAGADYVSLISKTVEDSIVEGFKNYGNSQKIYSNCFLWDNISPGSQFDIDKSMFYEKYKLNKNKPFFIWAPDSIQCQHQESINAYKEVCKIDNVIVKLHPNELRRHKADRVNYQWSHEMYTENKVKLLESVDTHSAFNHADAIISYQSSIGYELPFFKTPCIYLDIESPKNLLFNDFSKKCIKEKFEFVGKYCKTKNIKTFIENREYKQDYDYDSFLKKYLVDNTQKSYEILTQQIQGLL